MVKHAAVQSANSGRAEDQPCSLISMVMWGKLPRTAMTSSYFSSPKKRSMLRLSESLRLTRSCRVLTLHWRGGQTSHRRLGQQHHWLIFNIFCVLVDTHTHKVCSYLLWVAVAEMLLLKVRQLQKRRFGLLQTLHDHLRQLHAVLYGYQPRSVETWWQTRQQTVKHTEAFSRVKTPACVWGVYLLCCWPSWSAGSPHWPSPEGELDSSSPQTADLKHRNYTLLVQISEKLFTLTTGFLVQSLLKFSLLMGL